MVNAAVKEKCKLLLLFQGLVDEADLKKYKNYNHYQSLSIVFNHIAHIYIHNRISHNIIAVHMYGILFCIPIIYLIFAQILQFTRIWSIYPDIVLTCFNHITHTLSLYVYIFWGPYIFPIATRATRATRTAHRGGASSTARVAWSFSLRIIPGAGWPGMFVPIHSSCRVVSWDFMEIYGDLMGFYGGLMGFYGNLWWFHGI